jgi:hypothetical protein
MEPHGAQREQPDLRFLRETQGSSRERYPLPPRELLKLNLAESKTVGSDSIQIQIYKRAD